MWGMIVNSFVCCEIMDIAKGIWEELVPVFEEFSELRGENAN
jgi:hypothetical protein